MSWKSRVQFLTVWEWRCSSMPQLLYPQGKNFWYPLNRRLLGTPEPVWMWWWREMSLSHPAHSPITILTELPWLQDGSNILLLSEIQATNIWICIALYNNLINIMTISIGLLTHSNVASYTLMEDRDKVIYPVRCYLETGNMWQAHSFTVVMGQVPISYFQIGWNGYKEGS